MSKATVQSPEVLRRALSSPLGAGSIGAGVGTVQSELNSRSINVASVADLITNTTAMSGQLFNCAGYHPGSSLGAGVFVFDLSGPAHDGGYFIERAAGGVFRRLSGSETIEDYGFTGGSLSDAQIRRAIASGKLTKLNFNWEISDFVNPFVVSRDVDISGFRINGQYLIGGASAEGRFLSFPDDFDLPDYVRPFRAFVRGGRVVTDFNFNQFDGSVNGTDPRVYYVDPVGGVNGNSGLDENNPIRDINQVWAKEAISPNPSGDGVVIYAKPGIYTKEKCWSEVVNAPGYNVTLKPWGVGRIEMWYASNGLSYSAEGGGAYTTVRTAVGCVVDKLHLNERGDYFVMRRVETREACIAEPGTWFFDGVDDLTVHTKDSRAPDSDLFVTLAAGLFGDTESSYTVYCENVDFFGGSDAAYWRAADSTYDINVCLINCRARYGSNGFNTFGARLFVTSDCESSYNRSDGFNYHSQLDVPRDRKTCVIEINATAYECGNYYNFEDQSSNRNASTGHDNCRIIRLGGIFYRTKGPVVIDVNDCQSLNFFVRAGQSIGVNDNSDFVFSSVSSSGAGCLAWMDSCSSLGGSQYNVSVGSGAIVRHRNCNLGGSIYGARDLLRWDDDAIAGL